MSTSGPLGTFVCGRIENGASRRTEPARVYVAGGDKVPAESLPVGVWFTHTERRLSFHRYHVCSAYALNLGIGTSLRQSNQRVSRRGRINSTPSEPATFDPRYGC